MYIVQYKRMLNNHDTVYNTFLANNIFYRNWRKLVSGYKYILKQIEAYYNLFRMKRIVFLLLFLDIYFHCFMLLS